MTNPALNRKETSATDESEESSASVGHHPPSSGGNDQKCSNDIAKLGNGNDQDLSQDQCAMIRRLYDDVADARQKLLEAQPDDEWFACDYDTCRRYLVARQWKFDAAKAQLESTLEWRRTTRDGRGLDFWQSPKALDNPLALSMRPIGCDKEGRPICYTAFREAHDRWDPNANTVHMTLLMEACSRMIHQRRRQEQGLNRTATSRQWIFVVDFDGFGWRDQNPKSAVLTAKLLQHYPELLHLVILMNAPYLFSGMYKLVQPLLDERVKAKILFVQGASAADVLDGFRQRLGDEAVDWILEETKDNKEQQAKKKTKQYWVPPTEEGQHDARGMKSYVESEYYIKTPGDAYLERQQTKEKA